MKPRTRRQRALLRTRSRITRGMVRRQRLELLMPLIIRSWPTERELMQRIFPEMEWL